MRIFDAFKDRHEPEAVHILADTYWHALLVVCVMLAIGIISYDIFEFIEVDRAVSDQMMVASPVTDKLPFDSAELQMVVDGFVQRRALYQQYSAQKGVTDIDPTR